MTPDKVHIHTLHRERDPAAALALRKFAALIGISPLELERFTKNPKEDPLSQEHLDMLGDYFSGKYGLANDGDTGEMKLVRIIPATASVCLGVRAPALSTPTLAYEAGVGNTLGKTVEGKKITQQSQVELDRIAVLKKNEELERKGFLKRAAAPVVQMLGGVRTVVGAGS